MKNEPHGKPRWDGAASADDPPTAFGLMSYGWLWGFGMGGVVSALVTSAAWWALS